MRYTITDIQTHFENQYKRNSVDEQSSKEEV